MTDILRVGDKIADFTLKNQHDQEVRLFGLTGKVLLSFHPLAWTSVCAEQMKSLEANKDKFAALGITALGISVDTAPSKNAWARQLGIVDTALLSDFWPHGECAKAFGIFREANGFSERANIVLDEERRIKIIRIYPLAELPDIEEIFAALRA